MAITCFFAASYVNADIGRYYLVPGLIAWTWLAILGAAFVDVLSSGEVAATAGRGDRRPGERRRVERRSTAQRAGRSAG